MYVIMLALSVFGILTGIGLIRLRNWARISILIWGGLCVFFGGIGVLFAFFLPKFMPPNTPELPQASERLVRFMLLFVYGLPLIVGIWWLILFNRASVKAEFAGTSAQAGAALPQQPRCPLPVTVLAWFYLLSILNFAFLPFIPLRVPVFIFGVALPPKAGLILLLLSAVALFCGGLAMLKLKPWGYSLIMGLQVFWLISTAASLLSENYKAAMTGYMRQMQAWTALSQSQFSPEALAQQFAWMMSLGLVFAGLILGILVYYRPRFLEAADAARSLAQPHVPL